MEKLTGQVGELIASYKHLRSYTFRKAPMSMSAVGKILKAELRKPFREGHSRRVG